MAINKVEFGGRTLIDLTGTTATADKILTGYGAYGKDGVWVDGTAIESSPDGSVYQDAEGYVVLDDGAGTHVEVESLSVTENGTYTAPTGYAYSPVSVDAEPNLISKTVTPTETTTTYTASEEQNTILSIPSGVYFESVQGSTWVVDTASYRGNSSFVVGNTYTIQGQIVTTSSSALDIAIDISGEWTLTNWTATGTYYYAILPKTVTGSDASYVTNVDLMYYPDNNKYSLRIILNTITGSSHGHHFITDTEVQFIDDSISIDGYSAFTVNAMPSGTAGTPTATKGTVSNHSVSVTPSVTNATGYITGGTKTGTAVSVSASELVSGSQTITSNDTYDVTNLASVTVNVSGGVTPTGTINITTNGTHDVTNYATANVNVRSGGGSRKQINFIDYDGTLVQSYSTDEWANVTTLPSNPSHTGLIAQGWNWTKAQIDAQLTALPDGDIWIGQMYITESGDTEIDISMSESRLSPIMTICVNGTSTIDWGDNSSPDTITGISEATILSPSHTYTNAGNYTIIIHVVSGSFRFYSSTSSGAYTLLRKGTTASQNRGYANCVKKIRFGNNISTIGTYAFLNCQSLSSITIPSSVTSIQANAFLYCYGLMSATLPVNVTDIQSYTFQGCSALKSISISGNATIIRAYAFKDCRNLSSVSVPNSITNIPSYAFQACYSLSLISIPNTVTSIESNTFQDCHSLISLNIPDSVTAIATYAFGNCTALSSILIPDSVTTIGANAFRTCYSLSSVRLSNSITKINDYTFYSCSSLLSITIPSNVTSIGSNAFSGCSSILSINIPSSVTTIGTNAFQNCTALRTITIPNGVTSIGSYMFYNCYSLLEINIPNGITVIGSYAFYNCYSLALIIIPDSVTKIESNAFQYCYGMSEYHLLPTTPPTLSSTNAFSSIPSDCHIYVPYSEDHSVLEAYKSATNWSTYASYMVEESA